MRWKTEQLATFERDGLLSVEGLLSPPEVARLNNEIPRILARKGPENLTDRGSNLIRSAIAPHHSSELFRPPSRHPRMLLARGYYIYLSGHLAYAVAFSTATVVVF